MIWIPNLITAGNLLLGLAAFRLALLGEWELACWYVLVCVALDGLDGKLAKWLDLQSRFGSLFDSTADAVSFGLAPVAIFCGAVGAADNGWLATIPWVYTLCALYRLIRFQRSVDDKGVLRESHFRGLPTTASGGFYALLVLLAPPTPETIAFHLTVLGVLSALMVSELPVPNPHHFVPPRKLLATRIGKRKPTRLSWYDRIYNQSKKL